MPSNAPVMVKPTKLPTVSLLRKALLPRGATSKGPEVTRSPTAQHAAVPTLPVFRRGAILSGATWLFFVAVLLRFIALWANAFAGLSLPVPGSIGFTGLFTAFSLLHAVRSLGWRKALTFLLVCAVVSWCFETVGIETKLVYGPYHYGSRLGPKLGTVPVIIPLAWFMMVYASWVVARLLLATANRNNRLHVTARIMVAAMAMTTWDTVMDPGKALSGAWTWEQGGVYFGVPVHNFIGWLATTTTIYIIVETLFSRLSLRSGSVGGHERLYAGLPALIYGVVALDAVLRPGLPALRVVALFGMGFVALLAILRLILEHDRF